MADSINAARFIAALRNVIQAMPLADEDRVPLLEAVELRAVVAHKARQAKLDAARPPRNSREDRIRHACAQLRYRARLKAKLAAARLNSGT